MSDIDEAIEEYNSINTIESVVHNPLVKSFLSTIADYVPFFGELAIETLDTAIGERQEQKRKAICDIVFNSPELVTIDKIQDADFIISFARMIDTANRLNSNKKIQYLANLFKNTFVLSPVKKINEFDEGLSRLTGLSDREIEILVTMFEAEKEFYKNYFKDKDSAQVTYEFFDDVWVNTQKVCTDKFKLSKAILTSLVSSLSRTGFIEVTDIMYPGSSEKVYRTSSYFAEFAQLIQSQYIDI